MDPDATIKKFMEALLDGDHDVAREAHGDLTQWLAQGGFEPKWREPHRKLFQAFNPRTGMIDQEGL